MQDPNVPQGLDPTAFYLTKAIRQTETGGSDKAYTTPGKSGEYGAYQYTPETWAGDSQKYLGQSVDLKSATPEQQNQVAYSKVSDLLKQGHSQSQVASIWNSGNADPNKVGTGVNKYGQKYDVPGYINKVKNNYLSYSQGNGESNTGGYVTSANIESGPDEVQPQNKDLLDKAGDISKSILDFTGGNKIADYAGTKLGYMYEKAKGLFGGQDNSKYYDTSTPSEGSVLLDMAQLGGTIGTLGMAGSALDTAIYGGKALASPVVKTLLTDSGISASDFGELTNAQKLDALIKAGAGGSPSEKMVIEQAVKQLTPSVMREVGIGTFGQRYPMIARGGKILWNLGKYAGEALVGGSVLNTAEGLLGSVLKK